jgi:hypothetical protein
MDIGSLQASQFHMRALAGLGVPVEPHPLAHSANAPSLKRASSVYLEHSVIGSTSAGGAGSAGSVAGAAALRARREAELGGGAVLFASRGDSIERLRRERTVSAGSIGHRASPLGMGASAVPPPSSSSGGLSLNIAMVPYADSERDSQRPVDAQRLVDAPLPSKSVRRPPFGSPLMVQTHQSNSSPPTTATTATPSTMPAAGGVVRNNSGLRTELHVGTTATPSSLPPSLPPSLPHALPKRLAAASTAPPCCH